MWVWVPSMNRSDLTDQSNSKPKPGGRSWIGGRLSCTFCSDLLMSFVRLSISARRRFANSSYSEIFSKDTFLNSVLWGVWVFYASAGLQLYITISEVLKLYVDTSYIFYHSLSDKIYIIFATFFSFQWRIMFFRKLQLKAPKRLSVSLTGNFFIIELTMRL